MEIISLKSNSNIVRNNTIRLMAGEYFLELVQGATVSSDPVPPGVTTGTLHLSSREDGIFRVAGRHSLAVNAAGAESFKGVPSPFGPSPQTMSGRSG